MKNLNIKVVFCPECGRPMVIKEYHPEKKLYVCINDHVWSKEKEQSETERRTQEYDDAREPEE